MRSSASPLIAAGELERRVATLKRQIRKRNVRLRWRGTEAAQVHTLLARGNRSVGEVLLAAWCGGARFDGWATHFEPSRWCAAWRDVGMDPELYWVGPGPEGPLGWQHIALAPRAAEAEPKADGSAPSQELRSHESARRERYGRGRKLRRRGAAEEVRTVVRVEYSKGERLRFVSHLDLVRTFDRAIRRSEPARPLLPGTSPSPRAGVWPATAAGNSGEGGVFRHSVGWSIVSGACCAA